MKRTLSIGFVFVVSLLALSSRIVAQSPVLDIDRQPLVASTERLIEAMAYAGAPLDNSVIQQLREAGKLKKGVDAVRGIQEILDPLCVATININAESRVKVAEGPGKKELVQHGWTTLLVKVHS